MKATINSEVLWNSYKFIFSFIDDTGLIRVNRSFISEKQLNKLKCYCNKLQLYFLLFQCSQIYSILLSHYRSYGPFWPQRWRSHQIPIMGFKLRNPQIFDKEQLFCLYRGAFKWELLNLNCDIWRPFAPYLRQESKNIQ